MAMEGVDRYVQGKQIGQGSYGTVYQGQDIYTGKDVAIKVLSYNGNEKGRQDALKEIRTLKQLDHKNIVPITDVQNKLMEVEIVTKFCPNGSLSKLLDKHHNGIEFPYRLEMFIELMEGLSYIHGREIAHRNIKPDNILVDENNSLRIADVGLAKLLFTDNMKLAQRTKIYMQTFHGTIPYMAPEVYQGHYTTMSDIFSMGLVMFVICEIPPDLIPGVVHGVAARQNLGEYYKTQERQIPMSPVTLLGARNRIPYEIEIMNKMLQPDHHNRPKASEILQQLQKEYRRLHAIWVYSQAHNP